MAQNPPEGIQRLIPYIIYADAPTAIEFLCEAFGFEERYRVPMPDGRVGHAELGYRDSVVMLASAYEEMGLASPRDLPAHHAQIMCYVDDVDAHHARAKAAGAVVTDPQDQSHGDRSYRAADPEGHRWIFSTHLRDVSPQEVVPTE